MGTARFWALGPRTEGGRDKGRLFTREGSFRDACSVLAEGKGGGGGKRWRY